MALPKLDINGSKEELPQIENEAADPASQKNL